MLKYIIIFSIFWCISTNLYSQSLVSVEAIYQQPEIIYTLNFEHHQLPGFQILLQNTLDTFFFKHTDIRNLIVVFTFYPNKSPFISIGAAPAFSADSLLMLTKLLADFPVIHPKINDCYVIYKITIGLAAFKFENRFSPAIISPQEVKVSEFIYLQTHDKVNEIKNWISTESIPLLKLYITENFASKPEMLDFVQSIDLTRIKTHNDVLMVTDSSDLYWRAFMAAEKNNNVIMALKVCLHAYVADYEYAAHLYKILNYFSDTESLTSYVLNEFFWRTNFIHTESEALITDAYNSFDSKQLHDLYFYFPYNSMLNYYLYKEAIVRKTDKQLFYKNLVYSSNPFARFDIASVSPDEAYNYWLRNSYYNFFTQSNSYFSDFKSLANLLIKMELYGIAASVSWLVYSNSYPVSDSEVFVYYLFSVKKLGISLQTNQFPFVSNKQLKQFANELKKAKMQSDPYIKFKKQSKLK